MIVASGTRTTDAQPIPAPLPVTNRVELRPCTTRWFVDQSHSLEPELDYDAN